MCDCKDSNVNALQRCHFSDLLLWLSTNEDFYGFPMKVHTAYLMKVLYDHILLDRSSIGVINLDLVELNGRHGILSADNIV